MASGSVGLNITATVLGAPNQPGAAGPGAPGAAVPPYMPPSPSGGSPPGAAVGGGGGGGAGAAVGLAGPEMLAFTVVLVAAEMAIDALVDTAKALDGVFYDLAQTGRKYNIEVAAATSIADVRNTLGELEQANQLGAGLAGYVDARSDMAQTLRRIETDLLKPLLPIATGIVRILDGILQGLRQAINVKSILDELSKWLTNPGIVALFNPLLAAWLIPIQNFLKQLVKNTAPKPAAAAFLKPIEDFLDPNKQANAPGIPGVPPIGKP